MSIFLSWIEQRDFAVVILYKKFPSLEPLFGGYPRDREGKCPLSGGDPGIEVALGSVCTQEEKKMTVDIVDRSCATKRERRGPTWKFKRESQRRTEKKELQIGYGNLCQAPIVQKMDSAIHRLNRYPEDIRKNNCALKWIVIYP